MNKMTFASIAAVLTGLAGSPISAEAHNDSEAAAVFGGFVGGLIVGTAIHHNTPPPAPHIGVVVAGGHARHHGHWEWVTVRDWVPARWVYTEGRHGCSKRVWVAGYYECRRERVWVSHRGYDHCDRR